MADTQSQYDNRKSILDELEQINKELDQLEKEKKETRQQRRTVKKNTGNSAAAIAAAVGIVLVGFIAGFVSVGRSVTDPPVRYQPTVVQVQDDYDDNGAIEVYQMIMDDGFSIDGVNYKFDAPLSEFEANGWNAVKYGEDELPTTIDPGSAVEVRLKKDGYEISSAGFVNTNEDVVTIEEGTMDHVYCYDDDLERIAPFGIRLDMSEDELKDALDSKGLSYGIEEREEYRYYKISASSYGENSYSISVDIMMDDTGTVRSIYMYTYMNGVSRVISFS